MKPNLILYADDDMDDREMLQQVFSEATTKPFLAFSTADELLEFLFSHQNEVCAVILDINMPPKSGVQALQEIRDKGISNLPVVIYTTASNPLAKKSIDEWRALTLTKPPSIRGMQEVAKKVLEYCESFHAT